jgi:hypothetical protein
MHERHYTTEGQDSRAGLDWTGIRPSNASQPACRAATKKVVVEVEVVQDGMEGKSAAGRTREAGICHACTAGPGGKGGIGERASSRPPKARRTRRGTDTQPSPVTDMSDRDQNHGPTPT